VKRMLLLLAVTVFALSLAASPVVAGGNPFCPPNWPVCPY
jgi:hypothetical protein